MFGVLDVTHSNFTPTLSATMDETNDEANGLNRLADVITELSLNPYDISLHAQHISLSLLLPDMESEVTVAREMASNYLAVGDEIWIPLIDAKVASVDVDTPAGALEVLEVYVRAEGDYLCMHQSSSGRVHLSS